MRLSRRRIPVPIHRRPAPLRSVTQPTLISHGVAVATCYPFRRSRALISEIRGGNFSMETPRRRIEEGAISFHPALSYKSDDRASGVRTDGPDGGGTRAAVEVDARSGRDREWSGAADLVSHIPPLHIHPPESRLQYLNQGEQADARDGHLNLNGRTRTDDGHCGLFLRGISRRLRNRTTAAGIHFLRQRWVPPCPRHFPSGCPSS